MRGNNITNLYVLDGISYRLNDLSAAQLEFIESIADKSKYTNLRNELMLKYGEDVHCNIKIYFPEQRLEVVHVG